MRRDADEWIAKAENDYADARRIARARGRSDFSNACFLAQQCAEKYLKAVLVMHDRPIERTHDLPRLLDQVTPFNEFWVALRDAAKLLTDYAVRFRYPEGGSASKAMAKEALVASGLIRGHMRDHLGLGPAARKSASKPRPRSRKRPR